MGLWGVPWSHHSRHACAGLLVVRVCASVCVAEVLAVLQLCKATVACVCVVSTDGTGGGGGGSGGGGSAGTEDEEDWVALAHGKSASATGGRRREMVKIGDCVFEVGKRRSPPANNFACQVTVCECVSCARLPSRFLCNTLPVHVVPVQLLTSVIHLVDLAGSERVSRSGAVGTQFKVHTSPPASCSDVLSSAASPCLWCACALHHGRVGSSLFCLSLFRRRAPSTSPCLRSGMWSQPWLRQADPPHFFPLLKPCIHATPC